MQVGFEREFFVTKDGAPVVAKDFNLPCDGYAAIAEARGNPSDDVREAFYSLMADHDSIGARAVSKGLVIDWEPFKVLSKQVRDRAARVSSKSPVTYNNLYGHTHHKSPQLASTIGMHISVTNPVTMYVDKEKRTYNAVWDYAAFVRHMDKAFKEEIKAARRNPGFYEIKPDGRIEYRSLPSVVGAHSEYREKVISEVTKFLTGSESTALLSDDWDDSQSG